MKATEANNLAKQFHIDNEYNVVVKEIEAFAKKGEFELRKDKLHQITVNKLEEDGYYVKLQTTSFRGGSTYYQITW